MEKHIKKIVEKNGTIFLGDRGNEVWGKLESGGNKCVFTIFPRFIPREYLGSGQTIAKKLVNTVFCGTNADAEFCKSELALLIYNGYKSKGFNWLLPLDFEDLTVIFSGSEIRYINYNTDIDGVKDIIADMNDRITHSKKLLVYIQAGDTAVIHKTYEELCDGINISYDNFYGQASLNEILGKSVCLDVWYSSEDTKDA